LFIVLACAAAISFYCAIPALRVALKLPEPILPAAPVRLQRTAGEPTKVPLSEISLPMQEAMLAAEDHRFYEHHGIDTLGLIRVAIDNIRAGKMVEGGSTITQQLAKITFLDQDEKTATRKLSQIVLAVELESKYSKKRILEAYLNKIYFGRGAYGIEDAAETYFDMHAAKLPVAQAAFLAGVVREPSWLGDQAHVKEAIERQHDVIENMENCGYISDMQELECKRAPLFVSNHVKISQPVGR
jgi:membrane peptidoglycan carboxypeptidase